MKTGVSSGTRSRRAGVRLAFMSKACQTSLTVTVFRGTVEMAHCLKTELEYGDRIKQIWALGWDAPEKKREHLRKKLRRCTVTESEMRQLVMLCHRLRGKHNCVYDH